MSLTRTARSFLLAGMFLAAAATISRGAAAAPEADREEPAESPLIERATTELVLIEAYVTDAHGRALRGLNPDDFVLKVDRRRKPIGSLEFVEVAPEAAVPSRPSAEAPEATPAPFPGPTSIASAGRSMPRSTIPASWPMWARSPSRTAAWSG